MRIILLVICIFCTLESYARSVTELVRIDYPITYIDGFAALSNGSEIIIGKNLANMLTENELGIVVLHEAYHNLFRHSEKAIDEVNEFCRYTNSQGEYITCINIHKAIKFEYYQQQERQADYGAFRTAKKIGYDKDVCNLFVKLRRRLGEVSNYATHPSFQSRYNKCVQILSN